MQIPDGVKIKIVFTDSVTQRNILSTVKGIIKDDEKSITGIRKVTTPDILIKSFDAADEDLGFVMFKRGFVRIHKNYTRHLLYNQAGVALLSVGNVKFIPHKECLMLIGLIIDRKNKSFVFYKKLFGHSDIRLKKL